MSHLLEDAVLSYRLGGLAGIPPQNERLAAAQYLLEKELEKRRLKRILGRRPPKPKPKAEVEAAPKPAAPQPPSPVEKATPHMIEQAHRVAGLNVANSIYLGKLDIYGFKRDIYFDPESKTVFVVTGQAIYYAGPGGKAGVISHEFAHSTPAGSSAILAKLKQLQPLIAEKWRLISLQAERKLPHLLEWYFPEPAAETLAAPATAAPASIRQETPAFTEPELETMPAHDYEKVMRALHPSAPLPEQYEAAVNYVSKQIESTANWLASQALEFKARGMHHIGFPMMVAASATQFARGFIEAGLSMPLMYKLPHTLGDVFTGKINVFKATEKYLEFLKKNPLEISRLIGTIYGSIVIPKAVGKVYGRIAKPQPVSYEVIPREAHIEAWKISDVDNLLLVREAHKGIAKRVAGAPENMFEFKFLAELEKPGIHALKSAKTVGFKARRAGLGVSAELSYLKTPNIEAVLADVEKINLIQPKLFSVELQPQLSGGILSRIKSLLGVRRAEPQIEWTWTRTALIRAPKSSIKEIIGKAGQRTLKGIEDALSTAEKSTSLLLKSLMKTGEKHVATVLEKPAVNLNALGGAALASTLISKVKAEAKPKTQVKQPPKLKAKPLTALAPLLTIDEVLKEAEKQKPKAKPTQKTPQTLMPSLKLKARQQAKQRQRQATLQIPTIDELIEKTQKHRARMRQRQRQGSALITLQITPQITRTRTPHKPPRSPPPQVPVIRIPNLGRIIKTAKPKKRIKKKRYEERLNPFPLDLFEISLPSLDSLLEGKNKKTKRKSRKRRRKK